MFLKKTIFLIFCLINFLNAQTNTIGSQPQILFNYDSLKAKQEEFQFQVKFNKAILFLEKGKYKKAIELFKITSKNIKIPSFLNIAVAYYKLNEFENAFVYLNNIYKYKKNSLLDTYSYISACYYLYQIKKDKKYLRSILKIVERNKKLTEHSKILVVDTFVILKKYKKALEILNLSKISMPFKKALLYLKLKNYTNAEEYLEKAKRITLNQNKTNLILWLMIYRDLRANDIAKLLEHISKLDERKEYFKTNQHYALRAFFNKDKFTPRQYLGTITKFSHDRKIEFLFYFAPFIFSDNQEILYDVSKGFIFKNKQNIQNLEQRVQYNLKFIDIIKIDPILRAKKLNSFIKNDSNSYMYYNLALCYAQINDYNNAYKYFLRAHRLNLGNKLYSVMTLITADIIGVKLKNRNYIEQNIKSKGGMYKYFGQKVYKIFLDKEQKVEFNPLIYVNTIFYKSLDYLEKLNGNKITLEHPLLKDYYKDPLVYLMKATIRREGENDYNYFTRLQDNIPLKINNNFLRGSYVVTSYYIDLLKALGLFYKADFEIKGEKSPSYLRLKALLYLYKNKPKLSLSILNKLQKEYKLEDKYTMYLMVATMLENKKYNEASLQISLIKAILKDTDASFLTGVGLIQNLKLNSARQHFEKPYLGSLIDFKLLNFDKLLESL